MKDIANASLILTVLNEAGSLPELLESIERQDTLPSEIVVVDGGSSDATRQIVQGWAPPCGVVVHLIESPGATISQGRNIAIRASKNSAILVTDGGTALTPGWVGALTRELEAGADVAGGFFRPAGKTELQRIIGAVITPTIEEITPAKFLPSSRSVGFNRDALEAAGLYPEWLDYCEDLVLDLRLRNMGASFAFVPEAVATWDARGSLRSFAKQYYRYARGDAAARLWPRRHAIRFAAYGTAGAMIILTRQVPGWVWGAAISAGAAYLSKSYVRVARHSDDIVLPAPKSQLLVPIIVVIGDVAKMAGYAAGVARRWVRPGGRTTDAR